MLDKIAYDYVTALRKQGANIAKIKYELSEKVKKYSEIDKEKLRELIQKWLTRLQQKLKKVGKVGGQLFYTVIQS
ncbi:hypothetical protein A9G09_11940 [Gilliamella sp. wkB292]|nr:hypothetical protein A9G09_11940 [Gilliamella apicola]